MLGLFLIEVKPRVLPLYLIRMGWLIDSCNRKPCERGLKDKVSENDQSHNIISLSTKQDIEVELLDIDGVTSMV